MEEGKFGYVFIFDNLIDTYLCDIDILWITMMRLKACMFGTTIANHI